MHKVGALGLQKRRKGGSVAHDAVMHAIRGAVGIRFAHAEHGQVQIGAGAQRGQLPVSQLPLTSLAPASPQAAAACGRVVLTSQRMCIGTPLFSLEWPQLTAHNHFKNSSATFSGVNSG